MAKKGYRGSKKRSKEMYTQRSSRKKAFGAGHTLGPRKNCVIGCPIQAGMVIGSGASKCAIQPGFCGQPVASLMYKDDESFQRETDPLLLERLRSIDPGMTRFVYANLVNCATYDELSADEKADVRRCFADDDQEVPDRIDFFTTKMIDQTFVPHQIPERYKARFMELKDELHENGIAHNDLHGANLGLIDGQPVIFDFGRSELTFDEDSFKRDDEMLRDTLVTEAPQPQKRKRPRSSPGSGGPRRRMGSYGNVPKFEGI
jgi:hypothetical protein